MTARSYRVMMIPVEQYNNMVKSYDKAMARIEELEKKLNYSGKMVLANDRLN